MTLEWLRRVQWVLRAALVFALLISMAANILHADHDPIAQGVAGWSPLALFVAIEVMMRVPIRSRLRAGLRILATTIIAGIAAWTSYWHMVGVVARSESGLVPYLLPVSVDGLIIVLSVSLFDVASQIRDRLDTPPATPALAAAQVVGPAAALRSDIAPPPPVLVDRPGVVPTPASSGDDDDERGDPYPHGDDTRDEHDTDDAESDDEVSATGDRPNLAEDLAPLLSAARDARDELLNEGLTVSRDALATRLRRNGTAIRNTRVSELLATLKAEARAADGSRAKAPV